MDVHASSSTHLHATCPHPCERAHACTRTRAAHSQKHKHKREHTHTRKHVYQHKHKITNTNINMNINTPRLGWVLTGALVFTPPLRGHSYQDLVAGDWPEPAIPFQRKRWCMSEFSERMGALRT